jgi:hypothetical protein
VVAVAHPDLFAPPVANQPAEDRVGGVGAGGFDDRRGRTRGAVARFDLPPSMLHHHLLAVADAEDRHAELEDPCAARGLPSSVTLAGPPDRITALGANAGEKPRRRRSGRDGSRNRPSLAQAARDQLRHLAAEIDDQEALV